MDESPKPGRYVSGRMFKQVSAEPSLDWISKRYQPDPAKNQRFGPVWKYMMPVEWI